MNGKHVLYIDQYGNRFFVSTLKELREEIKGRASKMYLERGDKTYHVGYVIGGHWLTAYTPLERACN